MCYNTISRIVRKYYLKRYVLYTKGGSRMKNTIVTYETFHGSAKKVAEIISRKLDCKCINVDTPFEAEDLREIDNVILVFNFRGPYTAQLTKLYLGISNDIM